EGDTLVLSFRHSFHANALSSDASLRIFTEALSQVLGGKWKVRCEVGEPPAAAASTPPPPPPPAAPAPAPAPAPVSNDVPPPPFEPPPEYEGVVEEEPFGPDEPPPPPPGSTVTMDQAVELFTHRVGAKK